MAKCCANCEWSWGPIDEENLLRDGTYDEDDPNRPKAGDCDLGVSDKQKNENNYVCKDHSWIEGLEEYNNYVLYDEKYLGPGYFIISELDDEIIKFAKFYVSNNFGFPHYNVRSYEKDSFDKDTQTFRDIELSAIKGDQLFEAFKRFAVALNGQIISSIDPAEQGKNHFTMYSGSNISMVFSKDVYGVKNATDFIDINIGDDMLCKQYDQLSNFYQDLSNNAMRESSDKDIKKILKMSAK